MEVKKYSCLIERLNTIISGGDSLSSVSPTLRVRFDGGYPPSSCRLFIHGGMDTGSLNRNELLLAHTLLHKFYGGGDSALSKDEIKTLHSDIRMRINHNNFDKLDNDD